MESMNDEIAEVNEEILEQAMLLTMEKKMKIYEEHREWIISDDRIVPRIFAIDVLFDLLCQDGGKIKEYAVDVAGVIRCDKWTYSLKAIDVMIAKPQHRTSLASAIIERLLSFRTKADGGEKHDDADDQSD